MTVFHDGIPLGLANYGLGSLIATTGLFATYKTIKRGFFNLNGAEDELEERIAAGFLNSVVLLGVYGTAAFAFGIGRNYITNTTLGLRKWMGGVRNCYQCNEEGYKKEMTKVGVPDGIMDSRNAWFHRKCADAYINGIASSGYGPFSLGARIAAGLPASLGPIEDNRLEDRIE